MHPGTGGEELSGQTLNKILIKTLPSRAMIEYIRSGGEDLMDEEEILMKIEELNMHLLLCRKVEIQNTKKVQGGKLNARRKMNLPGLLMSPWHAEFMMEHTYGRIARITSSTSKRRKNTERKK